MAAYHQLGHDSWNLVGLQGLEEFRGVILSPVNSTPEETAEKLLSLGERRQSLEVILDPQLYKPTSDRGKLPEWPHFSEDVETMDLGNESWWVERCEELVAAALQVGANTVASPASMSRSYNDAYYEWSVTVGQALHDIAGSQGVATMLTAVVPLDQLGTPSVPERIATYLTRPEIGRVYLVFKDDVDPKRQRTDIEALTGACRLIRLLEGNGTRVLVAFSGLDLVLWKGAGASDAASGKFFNLRRFVPGRWDEPQTGGKPAPYWTDETLLTWLREQDLRLLLRSGLIDQSRASKNPFSAEILRVLAGSEQKPWVATSWRQYLRWFVDTEGALSEDSSQAPLMLKRADDQWNEIERKGLMLTDRALTGSWVRSWSNALLLS